MGTSAKENRLLNGLAEALGLAGAPRFEVLKTAAEALGCVVGDDGNVHIGDEPADSDEAAVAAAPPGRKRARTAANSAPENEEEDEEEDLDEEDDDDDDEIEDEGGEAGGQDGSSSDGSDDGSSDDEAAEFLQEPVSIEDPRRAEEALTLDEIPVESFEDVFQWLITPIDVETFTDAIYERQPAVVSRPHNREYFAGLLSKSDIDRMLRTATGLQYTYNVDVTAYEGGARVTYNFNGNKQPAAGAAGGCTADADVVWRRFNSQGCSVRVLHPQRSSDALWRLLARLEAAWQSCAGCNAYLTPPGSQGFAPHWDDIDAYVLQVEGAKRWRLYAPTAPSHVLPRHSSRDFGREELGECVLDVVLRPGDVLYMPRGTVHEAVALPKAHSLHLTISANQQRTWADLLGDALPRALRRAARSSLILRKSLPPGFTDCLGVAAEAAAPGSSDEDEQRDEELEARQQLRRVVQEYAQRCVHAVAAELDLDWAADHVAAGFMLNRLPPPLPQAGAGGSSPPRVSARSAVRLVLPGVARLVIDDDDEAQEPVAVVCHPLSNSRQQHAAGGEANADRGMADEQEIPPQVEFPLGCAATLAAVLEAGERGGVAVGALPPPDEESGVGAVQVVQALVDAGILVLDRQQR